MIHIVLLGDFFDFKVEVDPDKPEKVVDETPTAHQASGDINNGTEEKEMD